MDLEGMMLSEVSQRKKGKYCFHFSVESEMSNLKKTEWNGGYQGAGGSKLMLLKGSNLPQVVSKAQWASAQSNDERQQYRAVIKRDKYRYNGNKEVANYHDVHLKFTRCYMSNIFNKIKKHLIITKKFITLGCDGG